LTALRSKGASGYLPAQFLEDGTNQRTDIYDGSLENRARFLLEATDAAISVWGAARVSVRLWPRFTYNGMSDSDPEKTYLYAVEQLEKRKLGILHFVEMAQQPEGVKPLAPAEKHFLGFWSSIFATTKRQPKPQFQRVAPMLCRLALSSWQIPTYQKDLNSMRASMRQTRQLSMAGLKKDTRTTRV